MRAFLLAGVLLLAAPAAARAQSVESGASCSVDKDALDRLLGDLHPVLPQGCAPVDFKALGNRIRHTKALGLFTKIKLGLRAKGMIDDAKKYVAGPPGDDASLVALRKTYDQLFADFVKAIGDKDPDLVATCGCAREGGFGAMLAYAKQQVDKSKGCLTGEEQVVAGARE